MIYALAPSVVTVGASGGRSQEWLSCARVLRDSVRHSQSVRAPSADVDVADKQCPALQGFGLRGDLEQLVRVGWRGGFGRA